MGKGLTYCALDISCGGIAGILAQINRIGEISNVYCQFVASQGVKDGKIVNLGALSEAISFLIGRLKDSSGKKIRSAYVSIHGPYIFCRHSSGVIPISERGNKVITSSDIRKVTQAAYSLGSTIDEKILHQIPQGYMVDNQSIVLTPQGLYGHRLEVDLLLISASVVDLEDISSALDRAGLKVGGFMFSGLATASAVLTSQMKEDGCCLLDIGVAHTQLLFFRHGVLKWVEFFSEGWNSLVSALVQELKLPYELAEDVMVSSASLLSANVNPEQEVLIKKDQDYRPIKRKAICLIIEKSLQEMFSKIKEKLSRYLVQEDIPEGIIACGRIALLEGFLETLEANFSLPARLAKIDKPPLKDLTYASSIGLVRYAVSLTPKLYPLKLSSYGNIFQKVAQKSKEIYQEYF